MRRKLRWPRESCSQLTSSARALGPMASMSHTSPGGMGSVPSGGTGLVDHEGGSDGNHRGVCTGTLGGRSMAA